jgi:transcriptional regulator with XRE-family HTH domain
VPTALTQEQTTDLASRVRDARGRAGLTQEQLGEATGLSRDQVAAIEVGRRDVGALELYPLAAALKIRVLDLLGVDEESDGQRKPRYRNLPAGADASEVETFAKTFLRREASLRRVLSARA